MMIGARLGRKSVNLDSSIKTRFMKEQLQEAVMKLHNFTLEQISSLQIPQLMTYVEYKDMNLYNEFKMKFRKDGWII